jgi:signal transduction histidine kinase
MDARQAQIYTAIVLSSFVIGSILVIFAVSVIRQQRRNLALQRQNFLTEMNTLEKERSRMAADLHDELGVTLSFVKFLIGSVDTNHTKDQAVLADASARLDEAVGKVRSIAHNLMPTSLSYTGLPTALAELVQLVNQTTTVHAQLEMPPQLLLSEEESISIFRMVQEVVQNTLKHAAATQLLICLTVTDKHLRLLCEDNGTGFMPSQRTGVPGEGIGMKSLRMRAELLGGTMQLHSEKGRGTQYQFIIPLKKRHAD